MYLQTSAWGRAKKQTYNGNQYDSKFEASYAQELDLRKKAGEITGYDTQVNLELKVNGYVVCDYRIDFIVYYPESAGGIIEYVETKGYATPTWRLKWKLFEALYTDLPNTRLLVVKQKNNWKMRKLKKAK